MLFGSKTCLIARKYAISSFERVVNIGVAIAVQPIDGIFVHTFESGFLICLKIVGSLQITGI